MLNCQKWQTFLLLNLFQQIEASTLNDGGPLENSFLNKFNASDELLMLHEEQLKTPNILDGKANMSLITNKLESSLDLHDLEQFIDKKYCETRQRDRINCHNNNNLGATEEIQSSLSHSTKYGTFEHSSSSTSNMDIDTQLHKDICCRNCREKAIGKRALTFWNMVSKNI